jgi:hypothetical protein
MPRDSGKFRPENARHDWLVEKIPIAFPSVSVTRANASV